MPCHTIENDACNHQVTYSVNVLLLSLYSLIEDFFMILRLIKDFKSNVVFSASFDYDIDTYYIYIPHA